MLTVQQHNPWGARSLALLLLSGVLALFLFFSASLSFGGDLSETEALNLFHQANELFHRADETAPHDPEMAKSLYRQAAMRYEKIVHQAGIRNGRLYYNIANAYFRMEDIGRAILNYRRAQQYIPDDENLRQNLSYALTKRLDKIDEQPRIRVFKTLFFWHYDLSTGDRILLFGLFFVSIWVLAVICRWVRRPSLRWMIAVMAMLAALTGGSLAAESIALYRVQPGVILEPSVIARKGDGKAYAPSFKTPLHAGTEFHLLKQREDWLHIALFDGRTCWIPATTAELVR